MTRPTVRTTFKLVAKTERPSVKLKLILDNTFDNVFENFSEDSEIRGSIRIMQEFACKVVGIMCRLLALL